MRDSKTRRLYYKAIRDVLLTDWDPIGVPGIPDDEYDNYIPAIYGMLAQGKSEQEIADYLSQIEIDWMGFTPVRSHLEAVARKLLLIPSQLKS
jgi:hypothetical protein